MMYSEVVLLKKTIKINFMKKKVKCSTFHFTSAEIPVLTILIGTYEIIVNAFKHDL